MITTRRMQESFADGLIAERSAISGNRGCAMPTRHCRMRRCC